MFLIDKPFVSDFLINTIRDNNYKIVSTKEAKELISDESLYWISEEEAIFIIEKDPNTPIYINSENALAWIVKHLGSCTRSGQIHLFKDKIAFRELLKDSFPDFFYKTVKLEDIQELNIDRIDFPFVIKPSLGFFSLGVHIIHNMADWNLAKKELKTNKSEGLYPKEVIDTSKFIIEEFIEGEEYAVDCYFNRQGEPVILNILHHKFSSGTDVSDRVYSTSEKIIRKNMRAIEEFLIPIGNKAGLKNFPIHVEIRIDAKGIIRPIEVNALRFGGWCTTGDLSWYAFGFNSYDYYINNKKPNWEEIFNSRANKIYSIIILNNNSGFTASEITYFDYDLLVQDFDNVLTTRKLDIKSHPVFGFLFTVTSLDNEKELRNILSSDLRKYIST